VLLCGRAHLSAQPGGILLALGDLELDGEQGNVDGLGFGFMRLIVPGGSARGGLLVLLLLLVLFLLVLLVLLVLL
jgi:hypothetical protein